MLQLHYYALATGLLLWSAAWLNSPPATAQQRAATPGTGLRGQYYVGTNFDKLAHTRHDAQIDFDWTVGPNGRHFVAPGPGTTGEFFSVRWTGWLYVPTSGVYQFQTTADDGMRVWIGGRAVINSWRDQMATVATGRVRLAAGRYYPVRVEYYQKERDSRAALAWILPGTAATAPQLVPATSLYAVLPATARPLPAAAIAPPSRAVSLIPASQGPVRGSQPAKPIASAVVVPTRPKRNRQPAPQPAPKPASWPVAPDSARPRPTLANLATLSRGASVELPNLYFTQSTADLLPASRPVLNELAQALHRYPGLRLEVAGHTDNVGEAHLNQRLSEQRARVVRRYLLQKGIDSVRLTAVGYGGTRPVADNRDPQQRPRNRRVAVMVQ